MIQVESLTKFYDDFCAVDQINLTINKGEILGLLGPNGAGKTTTLRMLTGFITPTSGKIQVKDYSIDENPLEIKQLLGYLPESAPLYHAMLVFDYLNYVASIRGFEKEKKLERIRYLADLCGLNEVMHQSINELSKGYRQRVGLAHALMSDPEILILDEPTSGLDPNQIVEIRKIIKKIGKEKTIILSTHILSEAEATCDRIVIINRGKIVADDSAKNLKLSAGKDYLIKISLQNADFNTVREELRSVEGVTDISQSDDETGENILSVRIACRSASDIREAIYRKIKKTEWTLLNFHRETKTLEKIFRELTKEN